LPATVRQAHGQASRFSNGRADGIEKWQMGEIQTMKEDCESKVANLLAQMDQAECPNTKIKLLSKAVAELQKQIEELKTKA
jgi:hypothetical protein